MPRESNVNGSLFLCLGEAISLRRKRLGMSQEELADNAGVDRSFISSIERGKRNPSFGLVARIASGLKMRFARLVENCERCLRKGEERPGA